MWTGHQAAIARDLEGTAARSAWSRPGPTVRDGGYEADMLSPRPTRGAAPEAGEAGHELPLRGRCKIVEQKHSPEQIARSAA